MLLSRRRVCPLFLIVFRGLRSRLRGQQSRRWRLTQQWAVSSRVSDGGGLERRCGTSESGGLESPRPGARGQVRAAGSRNRVDGNESRVDGRPLEPSVRRAGRASGCSAIATIACVICAVSTICCRYRRRTSVMAGGRAFGLVIRTCTFGRSPLTGGSHSAPLTPSTLHVGLAGVSPKQGTAGQRTARQKWDSGRLGSG